MTFILTLGLTYIILTTLFLLTLFAVQQRRNGRCVETAREYAYTAAPDTTHRPRRLSSWRV